MILCVLVVVRMWNSGLSRNCFISIRLMMVLVVMLMLIQCDVLFILVCIGVIKVIMVSNGMISRFLNSRIDMIFWFDGSVMFLCLVSNCIIIVVEVSMKLVVLMNVIGSGKLNSMQMLVSIVLQIMICRVFKLKIFLCRFYRCDGCIFRLIMNRNIIMFSLVVCRIVCGLENQLNLNGLIVRLVVKYFSIEFSLSWWNSGIIIIVVLSSVIIFISLLVFVFIVMWMFFGLFRCFYDRVKCLYVIVCGVC